MPLPLPTVNVIIAAAFKNNLKQQNSQNLHLNVKRLTLDALHSILRIIFAIPLNLVPFGAPFQPHLILLEMSISAIHSCILYKEYLSFVGPSFLPLLLC